LLKSFCWLFQDLAGMMVEKAGVSPLTNVPLEPPDKEWAGALYLAYGLDEKPSLEDMRSVVIPFLEGSVDQATAGFVAGFILGRSGSQENTIGFLLDLDLNPEEKFDLLCTMRLKEEGLIKKEAGEVLKKTVFEKVTPEITKTREEQRKDDDREIQSQIYPLPIADMKKLLLNHYRSLDKDFQPIFLNLVRTESHPRGGWVIVPSASKKMAGSKTCYLIRGKDAFEWLRNEFF
jgi:hypothetical protein